MGVTSARRDELMLDRARSPAADPPAVPIDVPASVPMSPRRLRGSRVYPVLAALLCTAANPALADDVVELVVDPESAGPAIDANIFGQFAEHLGDGIYGGIWVGPDSPIPNTRGIRNDVVAALRALKVPNVRWPGGCFADEYHWRDGVGPADARRVRKNASWANRLEPNTFGTDEYFDFLAQIGADAYISANLGSGTIREAADWLEYMTATGTTLATERAGNGHEAPYAIAFWGVGNESWDCGGPFTAKEYVARLGPFINFSTNYNPDRPMRYIAVGPDGDGHADYTAAVMKAWRGKSWTWDIQGLSLHRYTRNGWPPNLEATGFDEAGYALVIDETLGMDDFIAANREIMDRYDPEARVAIYVDEWGTWYAPTAGTDPGYLAQQNSIRDAVVAALNFNIFVRHAERVKGANIAQMINVLQAMILTDAERMLLTPTYHAFHLYVPFQDAARLDTSFEPGRYRVGERELPRLDAIAARTTDGRIWIAVTNIDATRPAQLRIVLSGKEIGAAMGRTLFADRIDAVNTFATPGTVEPVAIAGRIDAGAAVLTVRPQSVTVLELR